VRTTPKLVSKVLVVVFEGNFILEFVFSSDRSQGL